MFMQSGCCKPPTNCGKNAAGPDTDCKTWSTNEDKLCNDCESCKARVLENMRTEWRLHVVIVLDNNIWKTNGLDIDL
ncbi:hypothetical protein ACSBR2_041649 [Camellia fascicularis]